VPAATDPRREAASPQPPLQAAAALQAQTGRCQQQRRAGAPLPPEPRGAGLPSSVDGGISCECWLELSSPCGGGKAYGVSC